MEHGSETYYVLGEGLLGESLGGREPTLARAAEAVTPPFRFSRMGPRGSGKQIPEGTRKALAEAMAVPGGGSAGVPAGYTYLGQFTDHDLTFDKTNVMLGEHVAPAALLQARSPSLDLDSLYGAGPTDPGSSGTQDAPGTDSAPVSSVDLSGTTIDNNGVHFAALGSPSLPPVLTVRLTSDPSGVVFTLLDLGRYQLLVSGVGLMAVTVLAPGGVTGLRRR